MESIPIICKIEAIQPRDRGRHFDLVTQWREAVEQVEELPDGYAFRLSGQAVSLMELAEFVSRESLCCPFFHFEIALEANNGPLWLQLLGGDQVKAFVRDSLVEGEGSIGVG